MITRILLSALLVAPAAAFAAAPGAAPAPAPAPAVAASTAVVNAASNAAVAAANQRFAARCAREPMLLDELLADAAFRADMTYAVGDERAELLDYASCRDLQGAAGVCGQLDGPGRPSSGDPVRCLTTSAGARFVFQTLRGGDAQSACRSVQEIEGQRGPAIERDCKNLIALVRSEGAELSCESLARAKLVTPQDPCDGIKAYWSGVPQDCDRVFTNPSDRRACRARAQLVAGLREPAKCSSSPLCQTLASKWPGACDSLRARFTRTLCSRVAKDLSSEQRRLSKEQELIGQQAKAKADAQAAVAAALRAKAEAALARSKNETAASQEKVAKMAEAEAVKKAAAEAAVKAKADVEARKAAEAKAKVEKKGKPQFRKGEAMQKESPEVKELMKAVEEGRPIPQPKPKPKPNPVPVDE